MSWVWPDSSEISPFLPSVFHRSFTQHLFSLVSFYASKGPLGSSLVALTVKNHMQCRRPGFDPWIRKILWRREWLPTPVFLPGEFHGHRSLAGHSPWGHKEMDPLGQLSLSLSMKITTSYECDRSTKMDACLSFKRKYPGVLASSSVKPQKTYTNEQNESVCYLWIIRLIGRLIITESLWL